MFPARGAYGLCRCGARLIRSYRDADGIAHCSDASRHKTTAVPRQRVRSGRPYLFSLSAGTAETALALLDDAGLAALKEGKPPPGAKVEEDRPKRLVCQHCGWPYRLPLAEFHAFRERLADAPRDLPLT